MSFDDTAGSAKTLAAVGFDIIRLFNAFESATIKDYQGLEADNFVEQQQRFELWANNIGLHQRGHASLDYRLRDAPAIHQYCQTLLEDLAKTLETLISELLSEDERLNKVSASSESEEVDETSDDGSSLDGYSDETTAEAAFAGAVDCINRLIRLSMKVRNPTMRTGLSKGYTFRKIDEDTGLDFFDSFTERKIDEEHIKNILHVYDPSQSLTDVSASYLVTRLAKANNQRRRQFAYWSQHKLNLVKRSDKVKIMQHQQTHMPALLQAPSSSKHSKPTTATQFDHDKIDLDDDARSVISTMSMRIPDLADSSRDSLVFPDPPEKAHILKDLRPYICTYEECKSSSQLYDSFHDWLSHELASHSRQPDSGFISDSDLEQPRKCPFCSEVMSTFGLAARHIAIHLIRIALFALPRSTGVEVEQDDRSTASSQNAARSRSIGSEDSKLTVSIPSTETEMTNDQRVAEIVTTRVEGYLFESSTLLKTAKQLHDKGQLPEAEQKYMQLLALCEIYGKESGQEDVMTLHATYSNLGGLYVEDKKFKEAEEMYLRALTGMEKVLGAEHTTLDTVRKLGHIYTQQNRLDEAEEMYLRALTGMEKSLGAESMSTLKTVRNLARLYHRQGRMKEAEAMYLRALTGMEKVWGAEHMTTLDTVRELGHMYTQQNRLNEVEEMYLRALTRLENIPGAESMPIRNGVRNLGNLYFEQGSMEKAEEMYLRALAGMEKAWDTEGLLTFQKLGLLYVQQGKLDEAEAIHSRLLDGVEKRYHFENEMPLKLASITKDLVDKDS